MLAAAIAGFTPSIIHTAGRHTPLSPLAAALASYFCLAGHFSCPEQACRERAHCIQRLLGVIAGFVLAVMIPLAYATSISMVRRGFDVSSDL